MKASFMAWASDTNNLWVKFQVVHVIFNFQQDLESHIDVMDVLLQDSE